MALNTEALNTLTLIDGLAVEQDGQTVRYKTVKLRETAVADEIKATEISERLMKVPGGVWRLVPSDETYALAMTMLACEEFTSPGLESLDQHVVDLDLFGKLSRPDLTRIEERVGLLEMAAMVRHGQMKESEFIDIQEKALQGESTSEKRSESQPETVATDHGSAGESVEMLADNSGTNT